MYPAIKSVVFKLYVSSTMFYPRHPMSEETSLVMLPIFGINYKTVPINEMLEVAFKIIFQYYTKHTDS